MSTVPLSRLGAATRASLVDRVGARSQLAPSALGATLLLLMLYAAFSHAAAALSTEAQIQVAIDVLVVVAAGAWLWSGALTFGASRRALQGLGLLAAFALWSGVTVLWSVAPNQTWIELNRGITYVLVVALAIAIGASGRNAVGMISGGFLLVALAVTCYALGQKLLPGLHVAGVFDLNQTGPLPRLQEPLGYWNALALFIAFGVPLALGLAADRSRSGRTRIGALISMQLMLLAIGLTYSRGGLIALAVGLAVTVAYGGARLRSLMWLGAGVAATIPPLVFGLANHSLSSANISLGSRESAGAILLLIVLVSSVGLLLGARRLQRLEQSSHVSAERSRGIARLLLWIAGVAVVVGLLLVTFSSRGLTGTISHAWNSFTTTKVTSNYDPQRLLSASSENRWVWWKEAAGAFSDRPIAGWGAGSFPVLHYLYRRDHLTVKQPHSVPLQLLAETGLIGALIAFAAFALLLAAALRAVKRQDDGRQRLAMAALLAGVFMFLVHSLYDWDWDVPAVTLPALLFLGVLVGRRPRPAALPPGPSIRALGLAVLTAAGCLFAVSAVLPSMAASKASQALVEAAGSPSAVQHAQATAELASRLDPLSDAGLLVEATIAIRRGQEAQARNYLISAVNRDPSDANAWQQLAVIELYLGDTRDGLKAGNRVMALDPIDARTTNVVTSAPHTDALKLTPPGKSATAQPLP